MSRAAEPVLVGVDLNATRVRVIAGPAGAGQVLPLDDQHADLPTAVSLEGRTPEVGRAGARICRRLPHLACVNFLTHLGSGRLWGSGRPLLTADQALAALLARLRSGTGHSDAVAVALPAYLTADQVRLTTDLAGQAHLPVVGVVATPFAAALAAHAEQPWSGIAIVLDADDHGLTWAAVAVEEGWARLLEARPVPQLGLRAWKESLLNAVADRCVRQSRRDPRDSATAEQALYDRLDGVLEGAWQGRLSELIVETTHWYQNAFLRPDEVAGACASLLRQALGLTGSFWTAARGNGEVRAVVLTAAAARLPGLLGALEDRLDRLVVPFAGDLPDDAERPPRVRVLDAEAVAGAVHELAERVCAGELAAGQVEVAPLPSPRPADAGVARLQFRGRDYPLRGRAFVLGHHPTCDLVLDAEQYPVVAARHCEITCDRRGFVLHDRSQHGTAVNDRPVIQQLPLHPGDWIQLGPRGPRLRFLGQAPVATTSQRPAASG
jgi:hypothetical protein